MTKIVKFRKWGNALALETFTHWYLIVPSGRLKYCL